MAAEAEGSFTPSCSKKSKTLPKSVSSWTRETLESLAIFYDDKTTDISFFMDQLKKLRNIRNAKSSTDFVNYIRGLVKKLLTLSVDMEEELAFRLDIITGYRGVLSDIEKFNKTVKEMGKSRRQELQEGTAEVVDNEMVLFEACCFGIRDFFKFFLRFLDDSILEKKRKCQFTQLFMKFARMFLMDPEPGDLSAERKFQVHDTEVSSVPDVLFFNYGSSIEVVTMVMSSEVKQIGFSLCEEKPFTTSAQDSKVLGQHGGQLLAEIPNSIFTHQVLGSICLKTKIIFTFLDIKEDHFDRIKTSKSLEGDRATIYFSKPYDFLIAEERDEILDIFALLGFVQSDAYKLFK
ncbi:uncharacterized protein [Argopecten irradians]|uniref:uncharacterized protein n=1 Tax=Argopecten irradians TaxID=31199 RepID=UPI0037175FA8